MVPRPLFITCWGIDEMKIAYFDLSSGISGDMLLGAFLDLGASEKVLNDVIEELDLDNVNVIIEDKGDPLRGKDVEIKYEDQPHRHLSTIIDMIQSSDLNDFVKEKSIDTFELLGEAEAKVHDMDKDEIEFHEVGMIDSIIDIVGSIALFDELGLDKAYCSTVNFGSGTVESAHGKLKVPVPATTNIIEGLDVKFTDKDGELVTPTGASLLRTLTVQHNPPDMNLIKIGVGYGNREMEEPNALRIFSGESANMCESVYRLQFYIDDMNPEVFSYALDKIRKEVVDVYYKNAHGKKSRDGWEVTVLCKDDDLEDVKDLVFEETSTLGMRVNKDKRIVADRKFVEVETEFGKVDVKVSEERVSPEYEDCKKIAEKKGIPLQKVYERVIEEYHKLN